MQAPASTESAVEALERFVVDNDDLSELEMRIGRFNIFDALNIAHVEIRHSNFLAWLLDPAESHGQGVLFLRAVLMDLLQGSPQSLRPFSPVELDGAQLRGVKVLREWRRIDILITCKEPSFVVAIENKVESGEHGDQLFQYEAEIAAGFPGATPLLVFLTQDRSEASRDRWVPYSYADIYKVLDRCRRMNEGLVGSDVLVFLDHYMRLIGSRFMDDQKIDDLCQRVYRNHRQALDLIFERVGSPTAQLVAVLEDLIRQQPERWIVCHRTGKEVHFIPKAWVDLFPAIGVRRHVDARLWIRLGFWCGPNKCTIWCYGFPTTDVLLRRRTLERLVQNPDEFGLRAPRKGITDEWTLVLNEKIISWSEDEEPDKQAVLNAASKALEETWNRLAGTADALRPIFEA